MLVEHLLYLSEKAGAQKTVSDGTKGKFPYSVLHRHVYSQHDGRTIILFYLFPSARTYTGAVRGRRGGRGGRGRGGVLTKATSTRHPQHVQKQNNPFLAAVSTQDGGQNPFLSRSHVATTTTSSQLSHDQQAPPNSAQLNSSNPFLASKTTTAANSTYSNTSKPPPPSYASIVGGGGAGVPSRPPPGPIPTFITHGPSSVQVQTSASSDIPNLNPSTAQNVTNPFNNPPSSSLTTGGNPLGDQKIQTLSSEAYSYMTGGVSLSAMQQSNLQVPAGLARGSHFPPSYSEAGVSSVQSQLPSYIQATNFMGGFQPGLQSQTLSGATQSSGAGMLDSNTTLHVKGVPTELNNEAFMEKHFSMFGPLKAIECNPQKRYATVTFQDKV